MNKIILTQPWGGLGDNLQFSTLPRLFFENNYDFYISSKNAFRNKEIYDLVWGLNPYFKGFSDDEPNAGFMMPDAPKSKNYNIIGWNEIRHGFQPKNNYAEIFYEPKFLKSYKDSIIIDVGSVSAGRNGLYDNFQIKEKFLSIAGLESYYTISSKYDQNFLKFKIDKKEQNIFVNNIFEYCDIIHSCKKYFCLFSGGAILSAAIKYKYKSPVDIFCFYPTHNHLSYEKNVLNKDWIFDNINYIL